MIDVFRVDYLRKEQERLRAVYYAIEWMGDGEQRAFIDFAKLGIIKRRNTQKFAGFMAKWRHLNLVCFTDSRRRTVGTTALGDDVVKSLQKRLNCD